MASSAWESCPAGWHGQPQSTRRWLTSWADRLPGNSARRLSARRRHSGRFGGGDRKDDEHLRPTLRVVARRDLAPVALHDGSADGQTHAQTGRFAAEVGLKHAFAYRRRQATPGVAHDSPYTLRVHPLGANRHVTCLERVGRHGLEAVEEDIDDDLLDLDRVDFD